MSNRSNSLNNETLTVLLKDFKDSVKENFTEIKFELKNVKDSVAILSRGQALLGGTYKELQNVCDERWKRFERFEQETKEQKEIENKLKENPLIFIAYKFQKHILSSIPWMLMLAIVIFALITNNPEILKEVIQKIHI